MTEKADPDPTRIVVDADVLAADLLVGGAARETMDTVRSHSWLDLVATEPLLGDAAAVIETLADPAMADEWREAVADLVTVVEQPAGDHPALAAAYRGNATQIVSLDDRLRSPEAGATLREYLDVSVRSPDAFNAVVDPATMYGLAFEDSYPGPDRKPR